MTSVLVLGAGSVAPPLVRYLLEQGNINVTVASRTVSKAERIIDRHPNGVPETLTMDMDEKLEDLISKHDVSVSLLPFEHHTKVARLCIKHKKHMVTTSYVSPEMRELDGPAKEAGVIILNEFGLDPGIDHMSAMKIIHEVEAKGGKILSFRSTTGALQAFEANNNPFGYKFSWAPKGVLLASKNPSKWLEGGQIKEYPGEQLFENYTIIDVPGVGAFENYPNRDSVPYKDIYGLEDAHTVYRGTFRMTGWCETMRNVVALGWLGEEPMEGFSGATYADVTRHLIGASPDADAEKATIDFLRLKPYATVIKRLEWLGLFSDKPLPADRNTPIDYLNVISLERMELGEGERDMVVMFHEFLAAYPDGREQRITSTLLDFGIPDGDTSIARTVGLPAAIGVKMILQRSITEPGVHVPVTKNIYEPVMAELETVGIKFIERYE
ncbi:MAG: saccharopine dehydrogenase NADP-binding domain-containing protein [Thermoplasmata archaeon]|nr:saccharopine dehydrogenase NADP-binding domain-containing protein [Thermoplasmata archaeon]